MNILAPELEPIMYSTVMQAQLAVGMSMQKGLKIPITLTQCLEPQPWNKLEIPESLNGEGVVIAIMASQGGFLLFIPNDGILLPAGYALTLSDPTEPLPIMAGELQRKLLPNAPEYVGKRIGRAKVFSSMARRAGIDDSAQILPVKLIIGGQESHVWFVGDVPHPERAFAKRNPDSELRSKKSKLFSDEILSNYSAETDFTSIFSPFESDKNTENSSVTDSETDISLHVGKTSRRKADLNRLLALKKNYNNELPKVSIRSISKSTEPEKRQLRIDSPHEPLNDVTLQLPKEQEDISDSPPLETHTAEDNNKTRGEADVEVVQNESTLAIATTTSTNVKEQHIEGQDIPESTDDSASIESQTRLTDENIIKTAQNESVSITETTVLPMLANEQQTECIEEQSNTVSPVTPSSNTSEEIEAIVPEKELEKATIVGTQDEPAQTTVVTVPSDSPATQKIPVNHALLSMTVLLEAVVSQRRLSLNEIVRWKPGSIIEFEKLESTINLSVKNIILAHGKPIESNSRIGVYLE